MVTLEQLVARADAELGLTDQVRTGLRVLATIVSVQLQSIGELDDEDEYSAIRAAMAWIGKDANVEPAVRSTLAGLDMHVNDAGEVCDPRPRPVINYPNQNGVRWRGSRRGGGRR